MLGHASRSAQAAAAPRRRVGKPPPKPGIARRAPPERGPRPMHVRRLPDIQLISTKNCVKFSGDDRAVRRGKKNGIGRNDPCRVVALRQRGVRTNRRAPRRFAAPPHRAARPLSGTRAPFRRACAARAATARGARFVVRIRPRLVHVRDLRQLELHGLHAGLGHAVMTRDVAALETPVGDRRIAAGSITRAANASASPGAALAPLAVPKLKSGSRPSKKRGTCERIECASHTRRGRGRA